MFQEPTSLMRFPFQQYEAERRRELERQFPYRLCPMTLIVHRASQGRGKGLMTSTRAYDSITLAASTPYELLTEMMRAPDRFLQRTFYIHENERQALNEFFALYYGILPDGKDHFPVRAEAEDAEHTARLLEHLRAYRDLQTADPFVPTELCSSIDFDPFVDLSVDPDSKANQDTNRKQVQDRDQDPLSQPKTRGRKIRHGGNKEKRKLQLQLQREQEQQHKDMKFQQKQNHDSLSQLLSLATDCDAEWSEAESQFIDATFCGHIFARIEASPAMLDEDETGFDFDFAVYTDVDNEFRSALRKRQCIRHRSPCIE